MSTDRSEYTVNEETFYQNFGGRFPAVTRGPDPAVAPEQSATSDPKRITDTTLRDGAQDPRFALFPHEAKLEYFDLLHRLDNGTGVIESIEVFIYQRRDVWVLEKLLERGYEYPRVTTWTRARPKDIKLLMEVSEGRIRETGMLASASDHHIFDKLRFPTKARAMEAYLEPARIALENGIRPRIHLEDATRADIDGWVIPFMCRALDETGGEALFRVCDTIGWGQPDPYANLPFGIPKLIKHLRSETGAELEFHGHNDFGLATANSMAAWTYGAKRVNTTFAGLGERTGNTSLEQMVAAYVRMYGDPGFELGVLAEMADLIDRSVVGVSAQAPMIGSGTPMTQAGIHQTGLTRQSEAPGGFIYLPYDPEMVGQRPRELSLVGALSGVDGLVSVLNAEVERQTGVVGEYRATSKVMSRVYSAVHDEYDGRWDGSRFEGARNSFFEPAELLTLARTLEKAPRD